MSEKLTVMLPSLPMNFNAEIFVYAALKLTRRTMLNAGFLSVSG